jgi:hypothetical protein
MTVSPKNFNLAIIATAVLAVALFPIWPYSRWGYTPSVLVVIMVCFMLMFKRSIRES